MVEGFELTQLSQEAGTISSGNLRLEALPRGTGLARKSLFYNLKPRQEKGRRQKRECCHLDRCAPQLVSDGLDLVAVSLTMDLLRVLQRGKSYSKASEQCLSGDL